MKNIVVVIAILLSACSTFNQSQPMAPSQLSANISDSGAKKYRHSIPIKFDLLLDEKITADDPRIKVIAYVSLPKNIVMISYVNPNAKKLANRIADILVNNGVKVLKPVLVKKDKTGASLEKYVVVYVEYV